ncbi:glycosyltransferase [Planctomycetota bacterium]|nr:glycosyltransferase [Planctomycetota bacterium]
MSKPTIAHILHQLSFAGAEVLATDLARKLQDQFNFIFLCLDGLGGSDQLGTQMQSEGFQVIDLQRQPGIDRNVPKHIKNVTQKHNIQLIHAHQYTPFFYASLSRFPFSSSPPIIFTEHGRHYPDLPSRKRTLLNRFLFKHPDYITAVGNFVRQALINNERIKNKPISVIYNGINPSNFPPISPTSRTHARNLLNLSPQDLIIMQVARFHPVKNHETSIRAFNLVAKSHPTAKLILVGDGPEQPKMQSLSQKLNLQDRIIFTGVRDDVSQILPAADIFTLSSLSEGISVTLLEAMATHIPIATTDVGGNPEVVINQSTGLLSPRQDHQALAQNLLTLANNPDLRTQFATAAHQHLQSNFTQSQMHAAYQNLYQKILTQS